MDGGAKPVGQPNKDARALSVRGAADAWSALQDRIAAVWREMARYRKSSRVKKAGIARHFRELRQLHITWLRKAPAPPEDPNRTRMAEHAVSSVQMLSDYARDRFDIKLASFTPEAALRSIRHRRMRANAASAGGAASFSAAWGSIPTVRRARRAAVWGEGDVEEYARETPGMGDYVTAFRNAWRAVRPPSPGGTHGA